MQVDEMGRQGRRQMLDLRLKLFQPADIAPVPVQEEKLPGCPKQQYRPGDYHDVYHMAGTSSFLSSLGLIIRRSQAIKS